MLFRSLAIRSCFVNTLSSLGVLILFPKCGSVSRHPAFLQRVRVSRVPRLRQCYQALRLPGPMTGSLMDSLACSHVGLWVRSGRRQTPPARPAPVSKPGAFGFSTSVGLRDLPGSWAAVPMPLPRSTIPASRTSLTLSIGPFRPRRIDGEGNQHWGFRDSITRL